MQDAENSSLAGGAKYLDKMTRENSANCGKLSTRHGTIYKKRPTRRQSPGMGTHKKTVFED